MSFLSWRVCGIAQKKTVCPTSTELANTDFQKSSTEWQIYGLLISDQRQEIPKVPKPPPSL